MTSPGCVMVAGGEDNGGGNRLPVLSNRGRDSLARESDHLTGQGDDLTRSGDSRRRLGDSLRRLSYGLPRPSDSFGDGEAGGQRANRSLDLSRGPGGDDCVVGGDSNRVRSGDGVCGHRGCSLPRGVGDCVRNGNSVRGGDRGGDHDGLGNGRRNIDCPSRCRWVENRLKLCRGRSSPLSNRNSTASVHRRRGLAALPLFQVWVV